MAILTIASFPKDTAGSALLRKVRRALTNLCGHGHGKDGTYVTAPRKLNADRDTLRADYKKIWKECTITFDPKEAGASIQSARHIHIGPFFLQARFTVMDMEKIILHEFLHAALDIAWKDAHHSMMEQIIKYNLRYPGPANVAEGVD
jgi:hypothetical protein